MEQIRILHTCDAGFGWYFTSPDVPGLTGGDDREAAPLSPRRLMPNDSAQPDDHGGGTLARPAQPRTGRDQTLSRP